MFKSIRKALGMREPSQWQVIARVPKEITWFYTSGPNKGDTIDKETITFFLQQDQYGNRKYYHHSYGRCKDNNSHEKFNADIIFWQETGVLPEDAEPTEFAALKQTP